MEKEENLALFIGLIPLILDEEKVEEKIEDLIIKKEEEDCYFGCK